MAYRENYKLGIGVIILEIKVIKSENLKQKPDETHLAFGREFTDHMFMMDYNRQSGWHNAQILPYGPIELYPSAMVLHYAQEIFEGLKAYKTPDGSIQLFRPEENLARLNRSAVRMCIPQIDEAFVLRGIKELLRIDRDWVPSAPGTSLYIRPAIFASDPCIGVKPGDEYKLIVILSPVGAYYAGGLQPTRMYVEDYYARTVSGGTGEAKCGGNYASSLAAQEKAAEQGYEQILWLDGSERRYIEEVGTSNAFFRIDGEFITPALSGTILPGITRKSVIELLEHWGERVVQQRLSIDEFVDYYKLGKIEEVFATGTAAVISPIGSLHYANEDMIFNDGQIGPWAQKIYDTLFGIQTGVIPDELHWTEKI